MVVITALEVQKRNKQRVNVYVDGEFFSGMQTAVALSQGLSVGKEFEKERLSETIEQSEMSSAFEKCADYLARSAKTTKQIRDYLRKKGFSPVVEEKTVAKLKEYRYVDDERYAQAYVEQNSATKGARRIKNELAQKGIVKEIAESVADLDAQTQLSSARMLAKKYMRSKEPTRENRAKLQRYLASRGFSYDVIREATQDGDEDDWD